MPNPSVLVAAALFSAVLTAPGAAEPSAARQKELAHRLYQDCGSCHGMTLKGGLGPALLPDAIKDYSDEALIETILNGREGTPMPPWSFELSQDDAQWIVDTLRRGGPHAR